MAPNRPALSVGQVGQVKQLRFNWVPVAGATSYKLLQNPDGMSGFAQVGKDLGAASTSAVVDIAVHLTDWVNALYVLEACNTTGCTPSAPISAPSAMLQTIGYFKSSNTQAYQGSGWSIAISADGTILAVGALYEASAAVGVNANQSDHSAPNAGAVYIFTRTGNTWSQQAYIKASNAAAGNYFGAAVALSGDGTTLAVGAPYESSAATGIDGSQGDMSAPKAGAVYVFARSGSAWSQQAYVKASNTDAGDLFGVAVALSVDGTTLAVGASYEASIATGINGDQSDNSAPMAGAVYAYTRTAGTWVQQAYIKASNARIKASNVLNGAQFGSSVALSGDGATLVVGARFEASAATGINGDQSDTSAPQAGAVYVFIRSGTVWTQQAYVKASNTRAPASNTDLGNGFGGAIALSADGTTLAVGAVGETSAATGINGNQSDTSAPGAGAAYVFVRAGNTWSQQAYVKASNSDPQDNFGISVALSADGSLLAVGAAREASGAKGIDGDQSDNTALDAGAVYVFRHSEDTWPQKSYIKASNTDAGDYFGFSLALSTDGTTLAVGAPYEASAAVGIDGGQNDNGDPFAGAVYLY